MAQLEAKDRNLRQLGSILPSLDLISPPSSGSMRPEKVLCTEGKGQPLPAGGRVPQAGHFLLGNVLGISNVGG